MVLSYHKHALNMVLRPASNSFDFLRLSFVSHSHSTAWQPKGTGLPSAHKTRGVTAPNSHFMSTSERALGPASLITF